MACLQQKPEAAFKPEEVCEPDDACDIEHDLLLCVEALNGLTSLLYAAGDTKEAVELASIAALSSLVGGAFQRAVERATPALYR